MPPFIHDDFLLSAPIARELYHEVAAPLPIIDYHCHLSPQDIAADRQFNNLAKLWVNVDPYKHRAMRICGVPEAEITGSATDRQKFDHWASTVPQTIGSPLYHWNALELKRYFGVDDLLSPKTANSIWDAANAQLPKDALRARGLLTNANVRCVCTSDRLLDDLSAHEQLAASDYEVDILPSLRGDDLVTLDPEWLTQLTGGDRTWDAFSAAVRQRLDAFGALGCRLADHGVDALAYAPVDDATLAQLFERHASGEPLAEDDAVKLRSGMLRWLGVEYAARGWLLQLHLGAQRKTSSRLRQLAGGAGGYAGIGNSVDIPSLAAYLDDLEKLGGLPRVILYNLNPADNAALAVLTGSFAEDGMPGKVQLGPAWWFNDHELGIRAHLDALSSYGLLATFIGMTTDSRSLLSMTRHEYFRRILCDWIGRQAEAGQMPRDRSLLDELVRRASFQNAADYLKS